MDGIINGETVSHGLSKSLELDTAIFQWLSNSLGRGSLTRRTWKYLREAVIEAESLIADERIKELIEKSMPKGCPILISAEGGYTKH